MRDQRIAPTSGWAGRAVTGHEDRDTAMYITTAVTIPTATPTSWARERDSLRMRAPTTPAGAGLVAPRGTIAEAGPTESAQR